MVIRHHRIADDFRKAKPPGGLVNAPMSILTAHHDVHHRARQGLAPTARVLPHKRRVTLMDAVHRQVGARDRDHRYLKDSRHLSATDLVDYLFAFASDDHEPAEVFGRVRWGGQFVFISEAIEEVEAVEAMFHRHPGFIVERAPSMARAGPFPLRMLGLGRRVYYFVARKVALIQPGERTDRFTFQVALTRDHVPRSDPRGYAVVKQVPTQQDLLARLRERHPDAEPSLMADRARKLVEKIFPVFLTREAAFLKILERDLPRHLRHRVPRLLHMEQDEHGRVKKLVMSWLRVGGQSMRQIEFAHQAATLLSALHENAGIIHLDLRLDNIVITPEGVGFVDFGSAVRVGEDISKNPLLDSLFDEMMSTSQIQRLLGKMKSTGKVTSQFICDAHGKVDKAVDLFYLAMQMNKPHSNPDLAAFIEYDPESEEAQRLARLTDAILRPKDPNRPAFTSAKDLLRGIERVEHKLDESSGGADGRVVWVKH
jgi:hypothetical protein